VVGQLLFMCGNQLSGETMQTIPESGQLICHIPRLPLAPGAYAFNFHLSVNGQMADYLLVKLPLTVVEGDYFGTGKLPSMLHGGILVEHSWELLNDWNK
jgi:lipopolysaccharide transport system ATP-binding protein